MASDPQTKTHGKNLDAFYQKIMNPITVELPAETSDYDVVPGTVYLVEHTSQTGDSSDILLLPVPSSDVRDPLVSMQQNTGTH